MKQIARALRSVRASLTASMIATATLAAAIAANTAIFSVYDQLVLHRVTLPDTQSLVAIWFNNPQRNTQSPSISIPRYRELRDQVQSFSSIGISAFDSFTLTGNGDAVQLNGLRIDATFLPTIGVLPARGRNFTPAEDVPNGPLVCILSHELWQTQFGGREMIGDTIELDGARWEVIGIMPPRLSPPFRQVQILAPRVFETSGLTAAQIEAGATFAQPVARLKPGVTLDEARAELEVFSRGYQHRHASRIDANNITEPRSFVAAFVGPLEPTMYTLLGGAACVLLIACANVSALFVSRLLKRRREIAVRLSLGAQRRQVITEFLTESLIIATAAAAVGTVLAVWALYALQSTLALQLPPNTTLTVNWRAMMFSTTLAIVSGVFTGLFPALQASRPEVIEALKDAVRGSSSAQGRRSRQALIVVEVTLSVVLLVGAALLLASFLRLQEVDAGFNPGGLAAAFVSLPPSRYSTPQQQAAFFEELITRLKAQPGVTAAAVAFTTPLGGLARTTYAVEGQPPPPPGEMPIIGLNVVSADYFQTLGIPIVKGRSFSAADRSGAPGVAVVNETFASRVFAGKSAIGQALLLGNGTRRVEIVGVIRDVKSVGLNVPVPDELYLPLAQSPRPSLNAIARTAGDPAALQSAIRDAVKQIDPAQATSFFATLQSSVDASLTSQRLMATLTVIFAVLAVVLSLSGLYSVLAHLVAQRTPEIGIRMALGASRRSVVRMVMQSGLGLVAGGLCLGLLASAALSGVMRQQLYDVDPLSVPMYVGVTGMFLAVAALACLAPSLRASRIDPVIAFRAE